MNRTILLADDSVTIRKVVELTFMDQDYELVAVASGTEAIDTLGETRPDVVIADVHMPGASGYDVCQKVKEELPRTPVLLLVGTFEPFDGEEFQASGADRYLKKPFDSQELLRTVNELLGAGGGTQKAAAESAVEEGEAEPAASEPEPESEVEPDTPAVAAAPAPVPAPAVAAEDEPAAGDGGDGAALSDDGVERIARRVAELISDRTVREVAWEVVPDLAEVIIKDRLRELEGEAEAE